MPSTIPTCPQPVRTRFANPAPDADAVPHEEVYRRVRAALTARGASPDEADEISQVAVAETWARRAAIRYRGRVVSYAVTIALRALAAERRVGERHVSLTASEVPIIDGSVNLEVAVEHGELRTTIQDAMTLLSERDRYLVLASSEGVSVDRMAAATGLKRESVAPSLHRARRRLRAHLVRLDIGAGGLAA